MKATPGEQEHRVQISFDEFCRYYNRLSDWARVQLVSHNQGHTQP